MKKKFHNSHFSVAVMVTIRYDSEYLTCSKKPTGSQLSLPHGTNKKLKCETKNKMMSVIDAVRIFPFHTRSETQAR